MTIQEIVYKYSINILNLQSKMQTKRAKCKSMKPIYNLRKYECILKKRKLMWKRINKAHLDIITFYKANIVMDILPLLTNK